MVIIIKKEKINIGIGFITGRKNFKNVIKTFANSWLETNINSKKNALHLFVAYDLEYKNTKLNDYILTNDTVCNSIDSSFYIGNSIISTESKSLTDKMVLTDRQANLIFSNGYAGKRNIILYYAIKNKMDYLIFLDDDEYPVAVINHNENILWQGQQVLKTHVNYLKRCDITHGYHCGYVSPIPQLLFNNILSENDFKIFIEAISNDIISWDSIKEKMDNGGVQYSDINLLNSKKSHHVKQINGLKFISGSNLGFNLQNPLKIYPFYNPPGARGEDTFLSSCLSDCNVQKIPCYTFHDGFSLYNHILFGVLPNNLCAIKINSQAIRKRFLDATIGWIRYKPLLIYLTNKNNFSCEIKNIEEKLNYVLPKMCAYFHDESYSKILTEFKLYCSNVNEHLEAFDDTKEAWNKIIKFIS